MIFIKAATLNQQNSDYAILWISGVIHKTKTYLQDKPKKFRSIV